MNFVGAEGITNVLGDIAHNMLRTTGKLMLRKVRVNAKKNLAAFGWIDGLARFPQAIHLPAYRLRRDGCRICNPQVRTSSSQEANRLEVDIKAALKNLFGTACCVSTCTTTPWKRPRPSTSVSRSEEFSTPSLLSKPLSPQYQLQFNLPILG